MTAPEGVPVEIGLIGLGNMDLNVVGRLEQLNGYVQDSVGSRWLIADTIEKEVPVLMLTTALFTRVRSRQIKSVPEKVPAALRNAFGGHAVHR
jgi:6-phosphogluconate dehydrogenase